MKPENSSPKIDYDVAIVGAGPVGLATALGLRQRGIENIIVFDQTRAFRKVGQVIGLYSGFQIDELHHHNQNLVGRLYATSLLWSTNMKTAVIITIQPDIIRTCPRALYEREGECQKAPT